MGAKEKPACSKTEQAGFSALALKISCRKNAENGNSYTFCQKKVRHKPVFYVTLMNRVKHRETAASADSRIQTEKNHTRRKPIWQRLIFW
jgi:hypothetical protein